MSTLKIKGEFKSKHDPITFIRNLLKEPDRHMSLLNYVITEVDCRLEKLLSAWRKMFVGNVVDGSGFAAYSKRQNGKWHLHLILPCDSAEYALGLAVLASQVIKEGYLDFLYYHGLTQLRWSLVEGQLYSYDLEWLPVPEGNPALILVGKMINKICCDLQARCIEKLMVANLESITTTPQAIEKAKRIVAETCVDFLLGEVKE